MTTGHNLSPRSPTSGLPIIKGPEICPNRGGLCVPFPVVPMRNFLGGAPPGRPLEKPVCCVGSWYVGGMPKEAPKAGLGVHQGVAQGTAVLWFCHTSPHRNSANCNHTSLRSVASSPTEPNAEACQNIPVPPVLATHPHFIKYYINAPPGDRRLPAWSRVAKPSGQRFLPSPRALTKKTIHRITQWWPPCSLPACRQHSCHVLMDPPSGSCMVAHCMLQWPRGECPRLCPTVPC